LHFSFGIGFFSNEGPSHCPRDTEEA